MNTSPSCLILDFLGSVLEISPDLTVKSRNYIVSKTTAILKGNR